MIQLKEIERKEKIPMEELFEVKEPQGEGNKLFCYEKDIAKLDFYIG